VKLTVVEDHHDRFEAFRGFQRASMLPYLVVAGAGLLVAGGIYAFGTPREEARSLAALFGLLSVFFPLVVLLQGQSGLSGRYLVDHTLDHYDLSSGGRRARGRLSELRFVTVVRNDDHDETSTTVRIRRHSGGRRGVAPRRGRRPRRSPEFELDFGRDTDQAWLVAEAISRVADLDPPLERDERSLFF
jgi:hypothetical protein